MLHFAKVVGTKMDPYRSAYDTAMAELAQITVNFDQLRTRKSHVENLITVLQQRFGTNQLAAIEMQTSTENPEPREIASPVEQQAEPEAYSFLKVPSPVPDLPVSSQLPEPSGDPFERRLRSGFRFKGISAQRSY